MLDRVRLDVGVHLGVRRFERKGGLLLAGHDAAHAHRQAEEVGHQHLDGSLAKPVDAHEQRHDRVVTLGPKAPAGTPSGSSALVRAPQHGHIVLTKLVLGDEGLHPRQLEDLMQVG
ncbi:MAG: hypothetical protein U0359_34960 [Byssovorax sp.]